MKEQMLQMMKDNGGVIPITRLTGWIDEQKVDGVFDPETKKITVKAREIAGNGQNEVATMETTGLPRNRYSIAGENAASADIQLNENKKTSASPVAVFANSNPALSVGEPGSDNVAEKGRTVKQRYSVSEDSEGNRLSEGQREYFAHSEVVDRDGRLLPMYHATNADFTEFDRNKIGGSGTEVLRYRRLIGNVRIG